MNSSIKKNPLTQFLQNQNSLFQNLAIEKIDVEDLIIDFRILKLDNLQAYLKALWKDLTNQSDNKFLGINKITFFKFYEIPGIISERLFSVFDTNLDDYLDLKEFVEGMSILFSENFEKLANFIFQLYDFNKDGYISKEDVRIVLSYIPLVSKKEFKRNEYMDIIESQDELHIMMDKCFAGKEDCIDFKTFLNVVEQISSDIVLYILIFLLEKRPFSLKTLDEFENVRKAGFTKIIRTPHVVKRRFMIASPNTNSKFSPSVTIKRSPCMSRGTAAYSNLNQQHSLGNANQNQSNKQKLLLNKLGVSSSQWNTGNLGNPLEPASEISNTRTSIEINQNVNDIDAMEKIFKVTKKAKPKAKLHINLSMNPIKEELLTVNTNLDTLMNGINPTNNNNSIFNVTTSTLPTEGDAMLVDENPNIQTRNARNNLQNFETIDSLASGNYNKIKSMTNSNTSADNEDLLPAFKYHFNKHLKKHLINQDKKTYATTRFTLSNHMNTMIDFNSIEDDSEEESSDVRMEGELFKISRGKKLKRRYFKLINRDLYYYPNQWETKHKGFHNLSGVFIEESNPLQFTEYYYLSFVLIFHDKARCYYCESMEEYEKWLKIIRKVTGYSNLNDIYEVKETLGNGRFGLVRFGYKINSGEKVAIKFISKKEMSVKDLELVRTEIEILKISQHPNIIKLYDVFENSEYIYIIMEYCAGGDLFSYLERRNFKIPESRAIALVSKLLTAIQFLHSFGIAHRDIKPENIMMTDFQDDSEIRILDFGLSKILGPNETCTEPYGTLSYVAPEVLLGLPYDKSADQWSIGIVAYLLLTGCLPFGCTSNQEVARKTISDPVSFPYYLWNSISLEAKDFIFSKHIYKDKGLLQKVPQKRMSIKDALEHSWIKKLKKPKEKTIFSYKK